MTVLYQRVHIVINPASGHDEPILNVLNRVFGRYGVDWSMSVTHQYGDAEAQARAAIADGVDLVAGYGGDGTQHEIANAVLGTDAVMGIPGKLEPAVELLCTSTQTRSIDVARVGDSYFFLYLNTQAASEPHRQCRHLLIETQPDQPVWTDGEYTGRTPVEVSVVPGALTIAVA